MSAVAGGGDAGSNAGAKEAGGQLTAQVSDKKNSLGIPSAEFVEDVDSYMARPENDNDAGSVLKKLDEQHQKYRFMEMNLLQKKRRLKKQIPDLRGSLDVIKMLKKNRETSKETSTRFLLSDQLYMKAQIPPTETVCLWLGANVMLEYPIDEAEALLEKNLSTATVNLEQLDRDLDFLRDQITTTEVTMARVYNWDVKRRQAERLTASQQPAIAPAAAAN